ncbi:phosphate starvation-inducible protein PhoH [archaeon]|nr:phosphate starvation-inducible protein PhoH [archaeon]|tara:strand:- start:1542 stop:2834 length:1293 start_codon:yes stop_codon:yes gene_type:complete
MRSRKTFILDTSVLLYDKIAIHSFPDSDVIIPLVVLDELDRFKEKFGVVGEAARYVNRYLDELRSQGKIHKGIEIENGQTITVEVNHNGNVPEGLSPDHADNRIIGLAVCFSKERKEKVTVITKDINFRVKCDALGIAAEDYYKDRIVGSQSQIYTGAASIDVNKAEVDEFFTNGSLNPHEDVCEELFENQFVVAKCPEGNSFLARYSGNKIVTLGATSWHGVDIKPRNKEQKFATELLLRDDIPLVTLTGIAGSGKTYLTLMAALSGLNEKKYDRIVITRTMQPVGKDIGFLPGDIRDKMDPWTAPIVDNFRAAFKDTSYFDMMVEKGQIEIIPLSFIRGRTFNRTFLIVDESQNSTIHELKTVITRVGDESKIALLGDIEQIDTPYIDSLSNGLTVIVEKFKKFKISGHVTLTKGERSKLATLASRVI